MVLTSVLPLLLFAPSAVGGHPDTGSGALGTNSTGCLYGVGANQIGGQLSTNSSAGDPKLANPDHYLLYDFNGLRMPAWRGAKLAETDSSSGYGTRTGYFAMCPANMEPFVAVVCNDIKLDLVALNARMAKDNLPADARERIIRQAREEVQIVESSSAADVFKNFCVGDGTSLSSLQSGDELKGDVWEYLKSQFGNSNVALATTERKTGGKTTMFDGSLGAAGNLAGVGRSKDEVYESFVVIFKKKGKVWWVMAPTHPAIIKRTTGGPTPIQALVSNFTLMYGNATLGQSLDGLHKLGFKDGKISP